MKQGVIIFSLLWACCLSAQQKDSLIVVKGQVSDYYITISQTSLLKGQLSDEQGQPLEGATLMFEASPVHCQTGKDGSFELLSNWRDSVLLAYYPGKEMRSVPVGHRKGEEIRIQLSPLKPQAKLAHTAVATAWFDPGNDHPTTYCNPLNISYNFRARIGDVTQNGAFRSTADPMIVVFKGEYYLFSTNQSGFYWSKNLSEWHYVFAGFQRFPEDDDQCAPAAFVHGDTLFYTGSTYAGLPVWYSTAPKTGVFKRVIDKNVLPTWDPAFLLDDDGRLYEYYGSSNEYPLKGV
ncbi:MAG: xylosidase, partial [Tannerellaceae bacterium]|nr:xylosidase [Tannerellaceae bacterium]